MKRKLTDGEIETIEKSRETKTKTEVENRKVERDRYLNIKGRIMEG